MRRLQILLAAAGLISACTLPLSAELKVFPSKVRLSGRDAAQQVIVGTQKDGRDVDLTRDAKFTSMNPQVAAACEFLGLDPLYVANEGKLVAICAAGDADRLLEVMRAHPLGARAAVIGEVTEDPHHFVQMKTAFGGRRIVDWLSGEQLPRIC